MRSVVFGSYAACSRKCEVVISEELSISGLSLHRFGYFYQAFWECELVVGYGMVGLLLSAGFSVLIIGCQFEVLGVVLQPVVVGVKYEFLHMVVQSDNAIQSRKHVQYVSTTEGKL